MDTENISQETSVINTNNNIERIIESMMDQNLDKNTTEQDFIKWILELRDAYLTNNLEQTAEILSYINNSYLRISREKNIYDFLTVPPKGYYAPIINESLFYIILHLEGLQYKDDLYLSYRINEIIQRNPFDIATIKEEMKTLFDYYLNDESVFIFQLSVDTKLQVLKMCLTYSLIDEYISFIELIQKDKTFAELTGYKEKNYEKQT